MARFDDPELQRQHAIEQALGQCRDALDKTLFEARAAHEHLVTLKQLEDDSLFDPHTQEGRDALAHLRDALRSLRAVHRIITWRAELDEDSA